MTCARVMDRDETPCPSVCRLCPRNRAMQGRLGLSMGVLPAPGTESTRPALVPRRSAPSLSQMWQDSFSPSRSTSSTST